MSTTNPHELALSILDQAISDRIEERTGLRNCDGYDKLSSEIGQLRTTRRMIADGSLRIPYTVPDWFSQFANQLTELEKQLTGPGPAAVGAPPVGLVDLSFTQQRELPGYLRRDAFGTLVMDYASGAVVPVNRLHFGRVVRYGGGSEEAVIYNFDPNRSTNAVRMLDENAAHLRSTAVIIPDSMTEIPLPM